MKIYVDVTFTIVLDIDLDEYEAPSRAELAECVAMDDNLNERFGNKITVVEFVGHEVETDVDTMEQLDDQHHHYQMTLGDLPR